MRTSFETWLRGEMHHAAKHQPAGDCKECGVKLQVTDNLDARLCRACEEQPRKGA